MRFGPIQRYILTDYFPTFAEYNGNCEDMKRYILACIILCSAPLMGKQSNDKKLGKKKLIEQADYYFFKEDFVRALDLYQQLMQDYPKNHYVQYHAFVAYHLSTGRGTEMTALKAYEENEGLTDKFYNYWLGRIHFSRYEFELAEKHFQAFLDMDIYRSNEIKKESEDMLSKTQRTQAFYNALSDFEIEPMPAPVNSSYDDISPAFYSGHEELLFASSRSHRSDSAKYQIFYSLKKNNRFSEPKALSQLGSFAYDNAKIEVVNNDGRLFFYKNDNGGDLFYSESKSSGWSNPAAFNALFKNQKVASHFFINDDETLLFFAAQGINNSFDIYQSNYDPLSDQWSSPAAILGDINSRYNEDHPFLSHDGKSLYFSSDRPESIGGHDIFKSEVDPTTGQWSTPVNVGFPINTIDDEIGFQLNPDNISGFLSSNRLYGQGNYDIYYFHKQGKVIAAGKVYDEVTNQPLPQAQVAFHPIKYQSESFSATTDKFGSYQLEVFEEEDFAVEIFLNDQILTVDRVRSSHDDHRKSFEQNFYVKIPEDSRPKIDFAALYQGPKTSTASYEKLGMISSKFRSGEKAILNNIYFDLQETEFQESSIQTLEKVRRVLSSNPNLRVEIGGHTCNLGSHETNTAVSLARAESVKAYLTAHGIDSRQLTTKGYGETQPLASNDDEEDGRELNRRIEIRVLQ